MTLDRIVTDEPGDTPYGAFEIPKFKLSPCSVCYNLIRLGDTVGLAEHMISAHPWTIPPETNPVVKGTEKTKAPRQRMPVRVPWEDRRRQT